MRNVGKAETIETQLNAPRDRERSRGFSRLADLARRSLSLMLGVCVVLTTFCNLGGFLLTASAECTEAIVENSRIADANTMESYVDKLLSDTWGSRYSGRVWTDKSVLAYGEDGNPLHLNMDRDGYDGDLSFDSDFGTIFSALTSSQIVNEYPPSPIDLVIVFDMSASMGQDTRYGLDGGTNDFTTHSANSDSQEWPAEGVLMSDRIEHSRIQLTLNAINNTIDKLMQQNPENRVAVCCYGANAVVLLPLAHYTRQTGTTGEKLPYLKVGGMETLYHPGDLVWREKGDSDAKEAGWYWINNRDTAYTVEAHAMKNDNVSPNSMKDLSNPANYKAYNKIISNNVKNTGVKAFPGVADPAQINNASDTIKNNSKNINASHETYAARSEDLKSAVAETKELEADDYVGYFTNTQGGIYLAYKQLADSTATTYTDRLSDGKDNTVARIPAAIIMSDGGANFAFNNMGGTVDDWNKRYGAKNKDFAGKPENLSYYLTDNSYNAPEDGVHYTIREEDYRHRLGETENGNPGNIGDEWYKVYLPGDDTLLQGTPHRTTADGKWDGLHTLYNLGADYYHDGTLQTQPVWDRPGVLYANDNDWQGTPATILEVLLTASYMKQVAMKHYEAGWEAGKASPDSQSTLSTYTMNVDTKDLPQWARWRLFPTLDPKNYPPDGLHDKVNAEPKNFGSQYGNNAYAPSLGSFFDDALAGNLDSEHVRATVFEAIEREWNALKSQHATNPYVPLAGGASAGSSVAAKLDMTASPYAYNGITVSADEILDHIAYNDEFTDVTSEQLGTTFDRILSEITGRIFVPISGDNDAGVGDSITYQDPLGEYMELKHHAVTVEHGEVTGSKEQTFDMTMLLFGEMHGLVRAGVYDYQWNYNYMHNNNKGLDPDVDPLPIGWYKGDALNAVYSYENGLPAGCDTAADAWNEGWVLRLNYTTLAEFVPISGIDENTSPATVPEQIKHTVYTCYRFADSQGERNQLRRNPVYGSEIPSDLVEKWDEYYNQHHAYPVGMDFYSGYSGIYRLSDIRVWTEHTGDYIDTAGAITPEEESGYDDSLYVNIPVAAIPTQLAEITLGAEGPIAYKDNLEAKTQSTPFRLFYAVGLTEDLILRDTNGKQTGVDVSKISGEYIASHSDPTTGNIYFLSNWYSNTVYRGYAASDTDYGYSTRGDAAVSFSPDAKNRYYLFQKALPLIAHAYRVKNLEGEVAPVDNADGTRWDANGGGNGKTKWETVKDAEQSAANWIGGEFIGTYDDLESFQAALKTALASEKIGDVQYIRDDKDYTYPLPEKLSDAIITYTKDQLSDVDSLPDKKDAAGNVTEPGGYKAGANSFSSDDYFFLVIEYYLPMDGKGKDIDGNEVEGTRAVRKVNRMIARKGSAFGSGLASENINNGDMLCWTDINGNCNLEIEYNSRSDTGDNTRGRPTLEKLTYTGDKLRDYLRDECGLDDAENVEVRDETGAVSGTTSRLAIDCDYWEHVVQADPHIAALVEDILAAENPQTRFNELFDWSVAARTGGIRVGDMYNNVQAKGGGGPLSGGYYDGNVTQTANNFYVPTLSETSTAGAGLVINNYLGNNGRLEIANDNLIVTKILDPPDGFTLTKEQEEKEEFEYQVFEEEMVGERLAQRLKWNPFSKSWQKRVESLDILTDNSSLLLDTSGKRALFCCTDTDKKNPRQVVEVIDADGGSKYYYADESGAAILSEECDVGLEHLYYMYLPSNPSGDSDLTYHLFGSSYEGFTYKVDGKDVTTSTEQIPGAGTTAYYPAGTDTTGMADNDMQHFAQEKPGRIAGSREYWTNMAELIPYQNVYNAEHPFDSIDSGSAEIAVIALEAETGPTRWDHAEDHNTEKHIPLNDKENPFTLVTVIPDPNGVESTVYSPFSSRTQYMTVPLYFGYKAELAAHLKTYEGGGSLANCTHANTDFKLTDRELFDSDAGSDAGSDADSGNSATVAQHTANFTLRSGEGLLLTGLGRNADYRFTEKLTDTQLAQAYMLEGIKQVTADGEDDKTSKDFSTNAYSVFGTTDYFTEQNHYTNTVDPELFVLEKELVDMGGNKVPASPDKEFTFTLTFKPTDEAGMTDMDSTLHYWRGSRETWTSNLKWSDGKSTYKMPKSAPQLSEYKTYLTATEDNERLAEIHQLEGHPHTYEIKLKAGEAIVFYGLIAGTEFTVTEQSESKYPVVPGKTTVTEKDDGYTQTGMIYRASQDPQAADPVHTRNRASFTNRLLTGALIVQKKVENADDDRDLTQDFTFEVKLTPPPGTEFNPNKDVTATKTSGGVSTGLTLTWDNNDGSEWRAQVTLKHGEQLLLEGLPIGTAYAVTETSRPGYNLQHVANNPGNLPIDEDGNYLPRDGDGVTGQITATATQAYLLFVNEKAPLLPFVGGVGVGAGVLFGVALLGLAALLLFRRRRKSMG